MEDLTLYDNLYNENYTDVRKNELIQRVFQNKSKSLLAGKSQTFKFADGGGVNENDEEQKTYTPYEFLHILLPKVYGRDYVVSDEVGMEYNEKIQKDEIELEEYTKTQLEKYNAKSLYKINDNTLVEEIEIRRRKIISDKSFITKSELIAYLFCHPELQIEHYLEEAPIYDVENMILNGLIMIDYDTKNYSFTYNYVHEYLSGNLYKKLTRLRQNKDRLQQLGKLSEEQFILQESALIKNFPTQAKVTLDANTCLFILPKSNFADKFMIEPEDLVNYRQWYSKSFFETFKNWSIDDESYDKALLTETGDKYMVREFFTLFEILKTNATEDEKVVYAEKRTKSYIDGKALMLEFMNNALTTNCQRRLEIEWNEIYNYYTEPKYYKIPVACHFSNKFKNGKPFTPNETQIQSIQFAKSVGSGLLAYGVGVGKTASAILNLSYALDNRTCKKPIFIVPNPTYQKWKKEMFGGSNKQYLVEYVENGTSLSLSFEDEKKATKFAKLVDGKLKESIEKIYGHIPNRNQVVDLYNLNEEYLRNIKNYTEEDELLIKSVSELNKYLKKLEKDYDFDDVNINEHLQNIFPQFDIDEVNEIFEKDKNKEYELWYSVKKNQEAYGWRARDYFFENVYVKKRLQVYIEAMKINREELPYTLGTLKQFEEGTIFFATYDALEHLGFMLDDESDLRNEYGLYGELFNEISQGDNISTVNYNSKSSLPIIWKNAVYGKNRTKIDIRDLEIDYAVFDESHFLKKVFTDVKALPRQGDNERTRGGTGTALRGDRKYSFGKAELSSSIALTGFLITRYIQSRNKGQNVLHLTATPFTNKPAEIYSMLALTNGQMLAESGFTYMEEFFDVFMDISYELIIGNTGVVRKESLLGYRNLPQLRNIIYSMMDYKSGEDANIKRPKKILFPSVEKNIETTLPESQIQDELFKQIKDYQRGKISWSELCADAQEDLDIDEMTEEQLLEYVNDKGTDVQKEKFEQLEKPLSEEEFDSLKDVVLKLSEKNIDPTQQENRISNQSDRETFRVMKGLGTLKAVTLSPYLSTCQKESGLEPTYTQFIETSPKLSYTIACIKSIHDYELQNNLRKSGVVIYMSTGVNVSYTYKNENGEKITFKWSENGFQKIKQYFVQKLGYSSDEVVMVKGGMSAEDKERAKNSFLSGKSTVLIGSSSISTGIDLQDNASALFLCSYDWNPTDNEQISGRIHRQGNRFEQIRIVYPMVMNSADPNIFQQLYEKTLRIKNIWDRNDKGNTLDLKDFDVNSLRKGILDDPEDLAKYWYEEQKEKLDRERILLNYRKTELTNAKDYYYRIETFTPIVKGILVVLDAYKKSKNRKEIADRLKEKLNEVEDSFDDIEDLEERFNKIAKEKAKIVKETYDFKNDPDERYKYLTYDEIGDGDDLLKKVNYTITNSDSMWSDSKKLFDSEKLDIQSNFLEENFPRFKRGKWNLAVDEEEDKTRTVSFSSDSDVLSVANNWKGGYNGMKKIKDKLEQMDITFDEFPQAIEMIKERESQINVDLRALITIVPQKIAEYTAMKQERRIIQPTIQKRVDEFASYNPILHKVVSVFKEDISKFVEVPYDTLPIKPKKKIKQIIEEAVLVEPLIEEEVVSEIDTTDLIENLKKGLLVRFNFGLKKGKAEVVDIFYEDGEFIGYTVYEDSKGEMISDEENTLSEQGVIDFYIEHFDKISEQFYDDEVEEEIEEVPVAIKEPAIQSKTEVYKDAIGGYQLLLEIETDEDKIQLYENIIEGYELLLGN
jgi:hypothetical protein